MKPARQSPSLQSAGGNNGCVCWWSAFELISVNRCFHPLHFIRHHKSGINSPLPHPTNSIDLGLALTFKGRELRASPFTWCGTPIKVWQVVTCYLHFTEPHRTENPSVCIWLYIMLMLAVLSPAGAPAHSRSPAARAVSSWWLHHPHIPLDSPLPIFLSNLRILLFLGHRSRYSHRKYTAKKGD